VHRLKKAGPAAFSVSRALPVHHLRDLPKKIRVHPTRHSAARQNGPVPGIAWLKITDPAAELPLVPPDTDLRVLLPDSDEFAVLADKLSDAGAALRRVKYLVEDEVITASGEQVGGVPYPAMYQVLEEAPRYLHWVACQGATLLYVQTGDFNVRTNVEMLMGGSARQLELAFAIGCACIVGRWLRTGMLALSTVRRRGASRPESFDEAGLAFTCRVFI
jgi:hypothetical protein